MLPRNSPANAKLAHVDNGRYWDPKKHNYDHHQFGGSSSTRMIFEHEKDNYEGTALKLHRRMAEFADRLDAHVNVQNVEVAEAFGMLRQAVQKVNDAFSTKFVITQGDHFPSQITSPLYSLQTMVDLEEISEFDKIHLCLTLLQAWWVKKSGEMSGYETVPGYIPPRQIEAGGELQEIIDSFLHEASAFSGQVPKIAHNIVLQDLRAFNEETGRLKINNTALEQIQKLSKIVELTNKTLGTGFQITHCQNGPWELIYWYKTLLELVQIKAITPERRTEIMRQLVRAYYLDEVISRNIIKKYKQIEEDPDKVFFVGEHKVAVFDEMTYWPKRVRHAVSRRLRWAELSMFVTQHPNVLAVTSTRKDGEQISLKSLHERLLNHAPDLDSEQFFIHPGEFVIYNYHRDRISLETTLKELEETFGQRTALETQPFPVAV
ncbi:hypothetical protein HN958_03690 [Candidatus Falkowbacteria bacterium]|nr:hypothetical protein [Candidatus Falkowbacteria bacterium]